MAVVAAGAAHVAPGTGSRVIRDQPRDAPDVATDTVPGLFADGVISTVDDETNLSFTPDGETAYFTKRSI
jgi:hypothetical protein